MRCWHRVGVALAKMDLTEGWRRSAVYWTRKGGRANVATTENVRRDGWYKRASSVRKRRVVSNDVEPVPQVTSSSAASVTKTCRYTALRKWKGTCRRRPLPLSPSSKHPCNSLVLCWLDGGQRGEDRKSHILPATRCALP